MKLSSCIFFILIQQINYILVHRDPACVVCDIVFPCGSIECIIDIAIIEVAASYHNDHTVGLIVPRVYQVVNAAVLEEIRLLVQYNKV